MKRRVVSMLIMMAVLTAVFGGIIPVQAKSEFWNGGSSTGFAGGSGTRTDPYIIETPNQLAFFCESVNKGTTYKEQYVKLAADLYMNDETFTFDYDTGLIIVTDGKNTGYLGTGIWGDESGENSMFDHSPSTPGFWHRSPESEYSSPYKGNIYQWDPIGRSRSMNFKGYFDGNGHTIHGLFVNNKDEWAGLFSYSEKGIIYNLNIENSVIIGEKTMGSIIGEGTVQNCQSGAYVLDLSLNQDNFSGGIVGSGSAAYCTYTGVMRGDGGIVGKGEAMYCHNKGDIRSQERTAGIVEQGAAVYCNNTGSVIGSMSSAGIIGYGDAAYCTNEGDVYSQNGYAGGIAVTGKDVAITYCYNRGNVCSASYRAGGIVAKGDAMYSHNSGEISGSQCGGIMGEGNAVYCFNEGTVNGDTCVGGIAGNGNAKYCYNTGDVSSDHPKSSYVGGIIGEYIPNVEDYLIECCFNTGKVVGISYVGGIAGRNRGDIVNCYNTGDISGVKYVGGIEGENYYNIENCYSIGKVMGEESVGAIAGDDTSSEIDVKNAYYILGCASTPGSAQFGIGSPYKGAFRADINGVTIGMQESDAKKQETYAFDFEEVWEIGNADGYAYPTLQKLHHEGHVFDKQDPLDQYRHALANCESGVQYYYVCECGMIGQETYTQGEPAHVVDAYEWESDANSHWHICQLCGQKADVESHSLKKGEITEQPTENAMGKAKVRCTKCQKSITVMLDFQEQSSAGKNQKLSDNRIYVYSTVFLCVGIAVGALGVCGIVTVKTAMKKRRSKDFS